MIYKIGEVAKMLGLTTRTLWNYDRDKKLVPDMHTPSGHRRYSKEQIDEYIKSLRKQLELRGE